jgi:hypothetical protein
MSRLTSMSAAAIKAVFSPESDDDLITLLTIYNPLNESEVLARLADGFTGRISETDDEVLYGVTSNSFAYTFIPMQISLPSEDEAQAPRCSIVLNDVTRYITPIIRTITSPPRIKLELVLAKSPNIVEVSFSDFYINNFSYNSDSVTADLAMIDYEREPFPMHSFTPRYFPGMF